jgi:hypothetical protein
VNQVEPSIPEQYAGLHKRYLTHVHEHKLPRLMWVVLDRGHFIMQLSKDAHIWWIGEHMRSGHEKSEKVGEEVMSRTLGEWSVR